MNFSVNLSGCLCIKERQCLTDVHRVYGKTQRTALHWAARYDNYLCLDILINAGADIEAKDIDQATPLSLAAWKKHCNSISVLVKLRASKRPVRNAHRKIIESCLAGSTNHPIHSK